MPLVRVGLEEEWGLREYLGPKSALSMKSCFDVYSIKIYGMKCLKLFVA